MYHSAEGTTWTKKNHKYINKIGGKYIYPSERDSSRRYQRSKRQYIEEFKNTPDENFKYSVGLGKYGDRSQHHAGRLAASRRIESRKALEDPNFYKQPNYEITSKIYENIPSYGREAYNLSKTIRDASINAEGSKKYRKLRQHYRDWDKADQYENEQIAKAVKKHNAEMAKNEMKKEKINYSRYHFNKTKSAGKQAIDEISRDFKTKTIPKIKEAKARGKKFIDSIIDRFKKSRNMG